jgi:hypothetical protein
LRECGYSRHVDVCHLRPVASFPPSATIAEVNAQDNLAAFCPTHHWELDAGLLQDLSCVAQLAVAPAC